MRPLFALVCALVVLAGCTTPQRTETPPGSGNYSTNYVTDPRVATTIETIRAVNEATKPVNPFSGLVEIGLGTATLLAAWFAKRKNDQLAQSKQLLTTVIQGVDQANNDTVKSTIQAHASKVGVEGTLSQAVAKVGNGTPL